MAQAPITIPNGTGAEVLTEVRGALEAITTQNSGASAPGTTYPYMPWVDTSTTPATIYVRNGTDTAWIRLGVVAAGFGRGVACGSFVCPAFTGTYSVNTLTFQGRIARFVVCPSSPPAENAMSNYGVAVSSSSRWTVAATADPVGTTGATTKINTTGCLSIIDSAGNNLVLAGFTSFNANGFTVEFTAVNTNYTILWELEE